MVIVHLYLEPFEGRCTALLTNGRGHYGEKEAALTGDRQRVYLDCQK